MEKRNTKYSREHSSNQYSENHKTVRSKKRFSKSEKHEFDCNRKKGNREEKVAENEKTGYNKKSDKFLKEKPKKESWLEKPRKHRRGAGFGIVEQEFKPSEISTNENCQGNSRNNSNKTTNRGKNLRPTKSFEKSFGSKKKFSEGKGGEETRLNKYIANCGICSRREADVLISTGVVKVNGEVIITMGYKVKPGDKVTVDGRELKSERKVYILLNKPKDTITTTDDPTGRKTVMDLVKDACRERVYPVGRLDRNTTGLILLTNDGDMAKRLMHPSHKIIKVYEATLNKKISRNDLETISQGVTIEEDFIPIDGIAWNEPDKKSVVGIELHSGKYHVVKRIFEKFGYEVVKLDRTMYGPLTKKNLPRGTWRFLTEEEISILHRI